VTDAFDLAALDAGDRSAKQSVDLDPERPGLATQHRQHRLADGRRLPGVERPLNETRELDPEEGVGVANRLRDHSGDALLEERATPVPIEAAHGGHEDGERLLVAARRMSVERGPRFPEERLSGRHRQERWFEQHQGVNALGPVERELERDRRTTRMAPDVSAPNVEVVEQSGGVRRVVGDGHGPGCPSAAHPTALVVHDDAIAVGELAFRQERHKAIRQDGRNEEQGLARSPHLVLQLQPVDFCFPHTIPA